MADRQTIRSQVMKLVGDNHAITTADIDDILEADDQEILEACGWSRRNAWTVINTLAPVSITVGLTNGSSVVTSLSLTTLLDGLFLRVASAGPLYKLGSFVKNARISSCSLPLTTVTNNGNGSYTITLTNGAWDLSATVVGYYLYGENGGETGVITAYSDVSNTVTATFSSAPSGSQIFSVFSVKCELEDGEGGSIAYQGTTDAAASSTLLQHIYRVSTTAERVLRMRADIALKEIDPDIWNTIDPERIATEDPPYAWCHMGRDSSGYLQVAFFPVPSAARSITVDFMKRADLSTDTSETLYPSILLKWMSGETAASFLLARTGDAAWATLADKYHGRYEKALEAAKQEDLLKSSPPTRIQEGGPLGLGSDEFALDHDTGF